jgi:hypothetical protein
MNAPRGGITQLAASVAAAPLPAGLRAARGLLSRRAAADEVVRLVVMDGETFDPKPDPANVRRAGNDDTSTGNTDYKIASPADATASSKARARAPIMAALDLHAPATTGRRRDIRAGSTVAAGGNPAELRRSALNRTTYCVRATADRTISRSPRPAAG